jgi:hypothetical protein
LVLAYGDCFPFHRNAHYARKTYNACGEAWACGTASEQCMKTVRR